WSIQELENALKTTALPVGTNENTAEPVEQGMGRIRPNLAAQTDTIIKNPLVSFGRLKDHKEEESRTIVIENTSNQDQDYSFHIPQKKRGVRFDLPKTFT